MIDTIVDTISDDIRIKTEIKNSDPQFFGIIRLGDCEVIKNNPRINRTRKRIYSKAISMWEAANKRSLTPGERDLVFPYDPRQDSPDEKVR